MAEEAPGEEDTMDEPEVEEKQLQETFESPPDRAGQKRAREQYADMLESSSDMDR